MEAYGHDASIAAPPFAFRAVYLSMFAARSHERGMLFGEAEDIPQQIQSMQLLGGSTTEDGEKRGVFIQKSALGCHAGDSVDGVFHQVVVARFGLV